MSNSKEEYQRLFIAIYPPENLVEVWFDQVREGLSKQHRLVNKHQVHLTLSFLGDTKVTFIDDLKNKLRMICQKHSLISIQTLAFRYLPSVKSARLLALCCHLNKDLAKLHYQCQCLRKTGRRDVKSFLPHLTICRFKKKPNNLSLPKHHQAEFEVSEIKLMASKLLPEGAVHHCLETFKFGSESIQSWIQN